MADMIELRCLIQWSQPELSRFQAFVAQTRIGFAEGAFCFLARGW
jgi:hypothetical protein